jgi:hypothetical protein
MPKFWARRQVGLIVLICAMRAAAATMTWNKPAGGDWGLYGRERA